MLTKDQFNEKYYNNGESNGGYTFYSENTYGLNGFNILINKYIDILNNLNINLNSKKILIVGCAYGFSIEELINYNFDAYGVDFSEYAISKTNNSIKNKIYNIDIRNNDEFNKFKTSIGMLENEKFGLIIDEDMFCCLMDQEGIFTSNLMKNNSENVIHIISEDTNLSNWYNYHSIEEWKYIIGNYENEKWYSRLTLIN